MTEMYHFMVRRVLRKAFRDINAGAFQRILPQFSVRHRHVMFGNHALAGERHSLSSTTEWYARLGRLLPDLQFEIHAIAVSGWPSRTIAMVGWTDHFTLPNGIPGSNQGVHEFQLSWGQVKSLQIHCDTAKLQDYCLRIAAAGVPEALAAPICDLS
jgi:hypothetical protein